jgi:hypothetical protein
VDSSKTHAKGRAHPIELPCRWPSSCPLRGRAAFWLAPRAARPALALRAPARRGSRRLRARPRWADRRADPRCSLRSRCTLAAGQRLHPPVCPRGARALRRNGRSARWAGFPPTRPSPSHPALSGLLSLSVDDRNERLRSGTQTFTNRVSWACVYLRKAGLLEGAGRGQFKITDRGREVLRNEPMRIDMKFLSQFPEFVEFRAKKRTIRRHQTVMTTSTALAPQRNALKPLSTNSTSRSRRSYSKP